jgi:MFS transporter, BCD family, chlorophyll transporter
MSQQYLGFIGILRLGLVQTALGAIVVLTTTTINRVMTVELALPALLPGLLVGLHYAVQITRPKLGYGSDLGGKRTRWIVGGLFTLAVGGLLAAVATLLMQTQVVTGSVLAFFAFILVGLGVGAAGTSLLVLLSSVVAPKHRGGAATVVWVMMIAGFIVTTIIAGKNLDPFTFERLVLVTGIVSGIAFLVGSLAVSGIEKRYAPAIATASKATHAEAKKSDLPFAEALKEVWSEPESRRFSVFVFISMLAYSAQDLVLEPFAGAVFAFTPGESTQLSGTQHGGVLAGMLLVAFCCSIIGGKVLGSLRMWTMGGCLSSGFLLAALAFGGFAANTFPLKPMVFLLGFANGAFAVAAIGSMMALVGRGTEKREGLRMGLWGAAQAIAFGVSGLLATAVVDVVRLMAGDVSLAYATVFLAQAALFVYATWLAAKVYTPDNEAKAPKVSFRRMALEINQ